MKDDKEIVELFVNKNEEAILHVKSNYYPLANFYKLQGKSGN